MNHPGISVSARAEDPAAPGWAAFTSAASDDAFCRAWLALQCGMLSGVNAGLLLMREAGDGAYVPVAMWPDPRADLSYLGTVAQRALTESRGLALAADDPGAERVAPGSTHLAYPLDADGEKLGVIALDLLARPEAELQAVMRALLWGTGWLQAMLRRRRALGERELLDRAAVALQVLQSAQAHEGVEQAAMAVANELATLLRAERVSVGLARAGKLQLRAISRTAWFDRKSQLVATIENAMDEAMDQEASVLYPVAPGARARVVVGHRDLAARAGAASVLSVPLAAGGRQIGAITLERNGDTGAFGDTEALLLELVAELLGPVFEPRLELGQWFAGRLARATTDWSRRLLGPRAPLLKLGVASSLLALVFLAVAHGEFRITARTVIEGQMQRAAVAPFDGYISGARVRAGDVVSRGELLATLDDREIRLELARWTSEKEQASRKYREALSKRDAASSRVYAAQQAQAEAQLALAEEKLARTRLVAPLDSVVVSGDLSQMLGAPVERGKVLFELAPLGAYRVILQVDDRDISYVSVGQGGELALAGIADATLPFTVKSVTSVSVPEEGRNYFRVEAHIEDAAGRLRPGMEGVGKIDVERRRLLWIWTRNFANWLRLTLWTWLP